MATLELGLKPSDMASSKGGSRRGQLVSNSSIECAIPCVVLDSRPGRRQAVHTGREGPGENASGSVSFSSGLSTGGGVEVEKLAVVADAQRLEGGTNMAGRDALAIPLLVFRRELECEGLGLNLLGGNEAGEGESGGDELHYGEGGLCCVFGKR